jgi:hypothetical protein
MKALRGFGCFVFFVFIGMFCQKVSAQCFVEELVWCFDEQFDNPCSGVCYADGQLCGLKVTNHEFAYYQKVKNAPTGVDQVSSVTGEPFKCAVVVNCRCVKFGNVAHCAVTSDYFSDYSVHPTSVEGDECPETP